jgi:hypothetical protein
MSYFAYAKFYDPTLKVQKGNVDPKPDPDLPKKGQPDGVDAGQQNPDYKAAQGWFQVIGWHFEAGANVDVSSGVSTGNVTMSQCLLKVFTGENTAVAYRALYNRSPFDLELVITERLGQGNNKMNCKYRFKGAVFKKIGTFTGDPTDGDASLQTTITAATNNADTKELDHYEFIYQAMEVDTFGTKTTCSVAGSTT